MSTRDAVAIKDIKDTQRKESYQAISNGAANWGHRSVVDDLCIHCGYGPDDHVRLETAAEYPHVHSRLYCDASRAQVFEAWWMR